MSYELIVYSYECWILNYKIFCCDWFYYKKLIPEVDMFYTILLSFCLFFIFNFLLYGNLLLKTLT